MTNFAEDMPSMCRWVRLWSEVVCVFPEALPETQGVIQEQAGPSQQLVQWVIADN